MRLKSCFAFIFAVAVLLSSIAVSADSVSDDDFYYQKKQNYSDYLQQNKVGTTTEPISIDVFSYTEDSSNVSLAKYDSKKAIEISENGKISYLVNVKEDGYYNFELEYYPVECATSSIKTEVLIDDDYPFNGAGSVSFKRIWKENRITEKDAQGNEIRTSATENPKWCIQRLEDESGLTDEPYLFFLSSGEHKITFNVFQNNLVIRTLKLVAPEKIKSYSDLRKTYDDYDSCNNTENITIEAETAKFKSDRSIVVVSDKSPSVSPQSSTIIKYNSIGGNSWKTVGEWVEWEFDITKDGLYEIGFHYKQDIKESDVSFRSLYIDGDLPYKEANSISFMYNSSWQKKFLGNEKENYKFYFSKGKHTIRLKATLGKYAEELSKISEILTSLNNMYTDIVMVTGPQPDVDRDYQFEKSIPDVLDNMHEMSNTLKTVEKELDTLTGETGGSNTATVKRLYKSLDQMVKEPETIAKKLSTFGNDITSLATWINNSREQPLLLDSICINSSSDTPFKNDGNFFSKIFFYIKQFFYSFTMDYVNVGNKTSDCDKEIRVWVGTGRDQADIIRQLVNESFTPKNNIGVNVQLVDVGSLLPATLANVGPDVYLSISEEKPIDYALRHAAVDLKTFPDCDEVLERFYPESLTSFSLDGGLYALPETMSFPMLFYRKDIMTSLGIKKEDLTTWDGLLQKVLPELDMNYFDFGVLTNVKSFANILYQNGGRFYSEDGKSAKLDSSESIASFELMTSMFTDYGMPKSYDFANRFRSGQMPLAIAEYTSFNQLSIFAPEINGLWDMLPIPGIVKDGKLNRTAVATVTGSVILSNSDSIDESWTFLKWWSSSDVQSSYANELETVMGTGARYAAANIKTMESINWNRSTLNALKQQLNDVVGMPYIAGSYYTTRSFDFAFRDVVYNGENLRECIVNASDEITNEIVSKRKEFYLDKGGKENAKTAK